MRNRSDNRVDEEAGEERKVNGRTTHTDSGLPPVDVKAVTVELITDWLKKPVEESRHGFPRTVVQHRRRENCAAPEQCPAQQNGIRRARAFHKVIAIVDQRYVG